MSKIFYVPNFFLQLRLSGELQRRSHLEEQKAELTAMNMEHEREVKVCDILSQYHLVLIFHMQFSRIILFLNVGSKEAIGTS